MTRLTVKRNRGGAPKYPLSAQVGSRMRELRKAAGLSQQALAARLGARTVAEVTAAQSRVSRLEKGALEFTVETLAEVASALGVPVAALVPDLAGTGALTAEEVEIISHWRLEGLAGLLAFCAPRARRQGPPPGR